jgi:hypothetical protein
VTTNTVAIMKLPYLTGRARIYLKWRNHPPKPDAFSPPEQGDCAVHLMSIEDTSASDFIFVDGLKSKSRGTIRSHISRQVCRQRRIKKALIYQKGPLSKIVGWQQRPESDDNDDNDDNDSLAKDVDPASTPADAAYEHEDNTRPKRRHVISEAGQAHPKHNPPGLLPPRQLSQRLRDNF